ncbi:transposase [Streptomyces sp. 3211]|uniref:transposase n=1 Tax=Streptomyces sp. 3211 TaxID=1964449 RepID=UPI000D1B27D9
MRGRAGGGEVCDHALGRSRGGLTAKIHLAFDGRGRPLGFVLTGGDAADWTLFEEVMDAIKVRRAGPGQPRTRPDHVLGDKGDSSRKKYVPACAQTRDRPHHPRTPRLTCQPVPTRPLRGQTARLRQAALQAPQRPRSCFNRLKQHRTRIPDPLAQAALKTLPRVSSVTLS